MQNIRVHPPTSVVFVCGGRTDVTSTTILSLRDAFMRLVNKDFLKKREVILAENLNGSFPFGTYEDILTLENHLAQISDVIILFSESEGSFAELGAFTMLPEIAQRLLIVIDNENYEKETFIKLGPIRRIENKYGDENVCVLDLKTLGIKNIKDDINNIELVEFEKIMSVSMESRNKIYEHTKFDETREGHIIKLITGFIQYYGALTIHELIFLLELVNINLKENDIKNFLLCAEFCRWIKRKKSGISTYYISFQDNTAIQFSPIKGCNIDKDRWRAQVIEYWKKKDILRFGCIQSVRSSKYGTNN